MVRRFSTQRNSMHRNPGLPEYNANNPETACKTVWLRCLNSVDNAPLRGACTDRMPFTKHRFLNSLLCMISLRRSFKSMIWQQRDPHTLSIMCSSVSTTLQARLVSHSNPLTRINRYSHITWSLYRHIKQLYTAACLLRYRVIALHRRNRTKLAS